MIIKCDKHKPIDIGGYYKLQINYKIMINNININRPQVFSVLGALTALSLFLTPVTVSAVTTIYTDEVQFEIAVEELGLEVTNEGFEDDDFWGISRVTLSDRVADISVTNNGFTWTSNVSSQPIATGDGPLRSENYGFFALPHGNTIPESIWVPEPQEDGFIISSDITMHAVGGWFVTNTYGAKISFILDGNQTIDFDDESTLDYFHKFYGIISTEGFTEIEVHEDEGTTEDYKYIYADDFTMAAGTIASVTPVDTVNTNAASANTADAPDEFTRVINELNAHAIRIGDVEELEIIMAILSEVDIESLTTTGINTVNDGEQVTFDGSTFDGNDIEVVYTAFDVEELGTYEGEIADEDDYTWYGAQDDSFLVEVVLAK